MRLRSYCMLAPRPRLQSLCSKKGSCRASIQLPTAGLNLFQQRHELKVADHTGIFELTQDTMSRQESKPCFVLSTQQSVLIAANPSQQPCSSLVFSVNRVPQAPFAWLGSGRLSANHLPFAKVGVWEPPASADVLMKQLLSEEPDEPQGPKRGHTDDWYQQRCIFCAKCKGPVNSHYQKKGSRCQGCRRWFHATCVPATAPSAAGASASAAAGAAAAQDSAEEQEGPQASSSSSQGKRRGKFFHDEDCQEVFDRLAVLAAAGPQPFSLPDQRPFWEKMFNSQDPYQDFSFRLLDLSEVRRVYKDAQKRETLFKEHKKVQKHLDAAAAAAAEREEAAKRSRGWGFGGSSSSSKGSDAANSDGTAAAAGRSSSRRRGKPTTSLEEFLTVSEVLKPLGESPRDLLEDSYAIITRDSSDGPAAVATFNVYGSDHARLQGVAAPKYMQRQGHATRLLQQVEQLLADAGVQDMVVILEPQDEKLLKKNSQLLDPETAKHWFNKRLGYKPASSEQQMLWRRELPEYHKGLIGGCSLLVKPLPKPKAVK